MHIKKTSKLFHLLLRLAFIFLPASILLLIYIFRDPFVYVDGVPHRTDGALGFAIYTFLLGTIWAIYLFVEMIVLFVHKKKEKAFINLYLVLTVIVIAVVVQQVLM